MLDGLNDNLKQAGKKLSDGLAQSQQRIEQSMQELGNKVKSMTAKVVTTKPMAPKKVSLRDFQKSWRKFKQEVSIFYEAQAFKG